MKRHHTTKITKATKNFDFYYSKLRALRSFVVKSAFSTLVAASPRRDARGQSFAFSSAVVSVATIVSKAL
jgi:hypothetical protein